jgi:hypothetical protein
MVVLLCREAGAIRRPVGSMIGLRGVGVGGGVTIKPSVMHTELGGAMQLGGAVNRQPAVM